MIVVIDKAASEEGIARITRFVKELGFDVHRTDGVNNIILGAVGKGDYSQGTGLRALPFVQDVIRIGKPYKLVSRSFHPHDQIVYVKGTPVGGPQIIIMAGPCAVESRDQLFKAAAAVKESGCQILRGGAFKPRTSPYAFQGMGIEGLKLLREAGDAFDLGVVTEVMDTAQVDIICDYADMLQIGARNMQNFALLKAVGKCKKPILLKRGIAATLEELLMAAEYIASEGNRNIVLCERGIRTYETMTRNTLDLSAIPILKNITSLPVIVDPSHATGVRQYVIPMARAGIAAGAHGIIVETHPDPERALCDGPQALTFSDLNQMVQEIRMIAPAVKMRPPAAAAMKSSVHKKVIFQTVAIIGVGLIGGSLAKIMRQRKLAKRLIGLDLPGIKDIVTDAKVMNEMFGPDEYKKAISTADVVFVATPVGEVKSVFKEIAPHLKKGAIVTDVCGIKGPVAKWASQCLPKHAIFIGGHPMAGSERRGIAAASAALFENAIYALMAGPHKRAMEQMSEFIEAIGARPLVMSAKEHDVSVASASHLPQLAAVALVAAAKKASSAQPHVRHLTAGGFRDMTRIASSPFETWKDILDLNGEAVLQSIAYLKHSLLQVERSLKNGHSLVAFFESAAHFRDSLMIERGALHHWVDVIVEIPDQPGVLATITTVIGQASINIRNMSIKDIREYEGGVLMISFESEREADAAVTILCEQGFHARRKDRVV